MHVQEAIRKRLSIRRYADAHIPAEHMDILFKALQFAASGNNLQNWEFVFADKPDLKQRLAAACFNQRFIEDCAYFIAGVVDPAAKWHMVDVTISLTQFTLQAVELGYGTCWIGAFDETRVKSALEIPEHKKVVICMTFGMPAGRHIHRGRKPVKDFIFLNRHGSSFISGAE